MHAMPSLRRQLQGRPRLRRLPPAAGLAGRRRPTSVLPAAEAAAPRRFHQQRPLRASFMARLPPLLPYTHTNREAAAAGSWETMGLCVPTPPGPSRLTSSSCASASCARRSPGACAGSHGRYLRPAGSAGIITELSAGVEGCGAELHHALVRLSAALPSAKRRKEDGPEDAAWRRPLARSPMLLGCHQRSLHPNGEKRESQARGRAALEARAAWARQQSSLSCPIAPPLPGVSLHAGHQKNFAAFLPCLAAPRLAGVASALRLHSFGFLTPPARPAALLCLLPRCCCSLPRGGPCLLGRLYTLLSLASASHTAGGGRRSGGAPGGRSHAGQQFDPDEVRSLPLPRPLLRSPRPGCPHRTNAFSSTTSLLLRRGAQQPFAGSRLPSRVQRRGSLQVR